ncbi:MAG TPA: outer membrane protein assembly factor BamD [Candidatus Marinimicrobia bacterium]|nr:outer membrane protein assembly factor BamD [Candidatus Neomarinimicrobiota bacterium]
MYPKRPFLKVFLISLLLIYLSNCASNKTKPVTDFEQHFRQGMEYFNKKKWDKAIEHFTLVVINSPGGELADDAQFYIAECYFKRKEYLLAASEYQQLINRYAYSEYVEEAFYKIALSQYKSSPRYQLDQEYSLYALQSFQDFIDTYPQSRFGADAEQKIVEIRSKLARKLFESGKLYRKLQEWKAAIIYFDKVLEIYYDTEWAEKARLEKAYCLIRQRNFDQYDLLFKEILARSSPQTDPNAIEHLRISYRKELRKIEREQRKRAD